MLPPSLIKRLLGEYDLSRVKAVQWGISNEAIRGLDVVQTGVWLHESGVLGASPDGLVGEDSVIEDSNFCLQKKDGEIVLKRDYVYWHQVQGHMSLTKRKKFYFVVWTLKDFVVLEIEWDDSWEIKIQELKDFYVKHLFPKIIEGEL